MSFFLLVVYVVSRFCVSCLRLFCLCCEWLVYVVILAGVSEGKKSGIGALGYLFTFTRVLFEFLTFWTQGDDLLRQLGRGFKAGKRLLVSGLLSHPYYTAMLPQCVA